jgi:glucosamine--fructose-6-phosphate aminotransferase (isomerizing)
MVLSKIMLLEEELIKRGYVFHSDTDTEVLVNLIEEIQKQEGTNLGKFQLL